MSRVLQTRVFLLLCAFGIAVRLALIATTFGTNDAIFWSAWARLVGQAGISGAYAYSQMVNHPPLALALVRITDAIAAASGIVFTDVFRLVQVAADTLSAFALYRIGSRAGREWGQSLALFVLLSPAAAFVSGFHCNSDPLMVALVAFAAMLAIEARYRSAAVALALAAGIKVVPVLAVPIFLASIPREVRKRFLGTFVLAASIIYLPAVIAGGPVVIRNIFGYAGGLPYEWGIPGVAFGASHAFPSMKPQFLAVMTLYNRYGRLAVYAAIVIVIVLAFQSRAAASASGAVGDRSGHRNTALQFTAILFMAMFALAPGFGVQYLAWLIPVIPFALPWRWAIAVNAATSLFLFITYTVWSGGWPWWFADIARPGRYRYVAAIAGYLMWSVVCAALYVALRSRNRGETGVQTPTAELQPSPGSG